MGPCGAGSGHSAKVRGARLNPQAAALVRSGWTQVTRSQRRPRTSSTPKLFECDPRLRPLFRGNMAELAALKKGPGFSPEVRAAWTSTCGVMTEVMTTAARQAQAAQADRLGGTGRFGAGDSPVQPEPAALIEVASPIIHAPCCIV